MLALPWQCAHGDAPMMILYSFLLSTALLLSSPVWLWRMLRQGRYREGLRDRLGIVPQRILSSSEQQQTIWLHAVSVGETVAAAGLVAALEAALPHARILVSTTTPTGQRIARERFGPDRVFFFPLDFAFAVRPYLRALRPSLVILMESELWPRMLVECERAGIPVAVVNARVSDRSFPRYLALRRLWTPLLRKLCLLLAQSPQDADRWIRIGAPTTIVRTTGNLKYDSTASIAETPLVRLLRPYLHSDQRPVLLAGSTHPGEEELLLRCAASTQLQLIFAPRHPQRTAQVADLITAAGLNPILLSHWRLAPAPLQPRQVLVVDTVGELAVLYGFATAAFVGGSLVPAGGHNPLEPARFGIPVLMGQHAENFRDIAAAMQAAGILQRTDPASLCADVSLALAAASVAHAASAQAFFQQHGGATKRTLDALLSLLPPMGETR